MNFAQPGWLILLLLLPALALAAVLIARVRTGQWRAFVAPRLRGALIKRGNPLPRWLGLGFLLVSSGLLIGALARPQGDAGTRTEKVMGRNVLVALDISRSMRVTDVNPDRLGQAKVVIYELLEAMPNDRVGLIGFAGSPFLYAPLTVDHTAVRETIEQIDEKWAAGGGTDIAAAVRLATATLKETGQQNNVLVLISDGEEHEGDLDVMISEAARAGVFIYAIGVGTPDGGLVPHAEFPNEPTLDRQGQPVISRLRPEVLRKLSEETGGRFVMAGSGADIPAIVRAAVQDLEAFEIEGRERRVTIEFYQYLLLPAILFMMVSILAGTRWRGVKTAAVASAALMFGIPAARADAIADARRALESGRYEEARDAYRRLAENATLPDRAARFSVGEGTAAYRDNKFPAARSAFSRALLAKDPEVVSGAHLGLGNTLFQLGWLGLTEETYPSDPAEVPDMDSFDAIVRERLANMMRADAPEAGETDGFARFRALMVNWADAARHFESAAQAAPDDPAARRNRDTTITYLRRLRELLDEDEQQTQDSIDQQEQNQEDGEGGEGEPGEQEGQGESGDEPGEGEPRQDPNGEPGDQPGDNQGEPGPEEGDEPPPEGEGDGGEPETEGDEGGEGEEEFPDETPEERARRILQGNADLERGIPNQGPNQLRDPEKDW
jgi:Ca-activated chloride channel family protein